MGGSVDAPESLFGLLFVRTNNTTRHDTTRHDTIHRHGSSRQSMAAWSGLTASAYPTCLGVHVRVWWVSVQLAACCCWILPLGTDWTLFDKKWDG